MKYDIEKVIISFDGKPIKIGQTEEKYTYRIAINNALQASDPQAPDTADLKGKIFQILTKLWATKEPEFTAEQIVIINEKAGRWAPPLEMGRIKEFLEPEEKKDEPKARS